MANTNMMKVMVMLENKYDGDDSKYEYGEGDGDARKQKYDDGEMVKVMMSKTNVVKVMMMLENK